MPRAVCGRMCIHAGSIGNSQCTVAWGTAPVTTSSTSLTVALTITFSQSFGGNRVFYLAARDTNDVNNTDWQAMGTVDYALSSWINLHVGYRSLNFNYSTEVGNLGFNVHMRGPIFAGTFRF